MPDRPAPEDLARYRALVYGAPAAIVGTNGDGKIVLANAAAEALFGWSGRELIGRSIDMLVPAALDDVRAMRPPGSAGHPEVRPMGTGGDVYAMRRDGSEFPVEFSLAPTSTRAGLLVQVMVLDLTDRKRVEAELERRLAQQASIAQLGARALEGGPVTELLDLAVGMVRERLDVQYVQVLEADEEDGWLTVSATARRVSSDLAGGLDAAAPSLRDIEPGARFRVAGTHAQAALEADAPIVVADAATGADAPAGLMKRFGFRSGASVRIGMSGAALGVLGAYCSTVRRFDAHDEYFLQAVANVLADAITRRRIEDDMSRRALTDALTGLPNRVLLMDRLAHWRESAMRSGAQAALLFLDLDHFKVINDSLGHDAGDDLLRAIGPRLQGAVRPSDTVARFGGDEFVVLCEDITEEGAEAVAQRILAAFAQPISLQGRSHVVSPSIGVALSGTPPLSADALVTNADAALYRAKGRGRGRAELFQAGMHRRFVRRMSLERALRTALAGGEGLRVVYQPVVSLDTGAPAGFEALARWTHPIDGEVPPAEFVAVAEESGLIVDLGRWVLCEALAQAGAWHAAHPGSDGARVSVNLSPRQVSDPRLVETIAQALKDAHTPHGSLSLEVTETVLMDDTDLMLEVMYRLRALGVRLVLDDFGTGYSSLSHVRRFPIAALKLDKTFVDEVRTDPSSRAIVSAVLHLAEGLGADVVAEGVETRGQADAVRELGCPLGQGYLFGRPMEPEQAAEMLAHAAAV